ncbi:MAG: hypothetical protein KJ607_13655, partial [Bacteroidetes bacterium]|nr:hypothetical protein [Bacteroidota bacterium]
GIGTTSPDKQLHVAGDARITGDIYYGTGANIYNKPDYVFNECYDRYLPVLEVEAFLNKNGHLPWVTPADKESDGINFTRMGFETLESVENLQLQLIEMKKENLAMQKKLESLEDIKQEYFSVLKELDEIRNKLSPLRETVTDAPDSPK